MNQSPSNNPEPHAESFVAENARLKAEVQEKDLFIETLLKNIARKNKDLEQLQKVYDCLSKRLFNKRFADLDSNQLNLAFAQLDQEEQQPNAPEFINEAPDEESPSKPRKKKKKKAKGGHGRGEFPEHLPRKRIEVEL